MISKLKQYRIENRYTQQQMADLLNISLRAYRNYEYGKRQMPYKILSKFLYIRNDSQDRELSRILKECETKE
jgi:transcriptional regulator with XRE-family HTH domain